MAETHIQIGDITPRIQYTGDGAQTLFTYPFPIFQAADMEVYLDDVKQATGFTVNGAGQSAGGDATFDTAPANGVVVTLRRRLAIQRTSDFQESGEFRSKVINDELDYLTAALQQVSDDGERTLRLGATDQTASLTLPDKAARADMYLGFDANGDPIATDASGPVGPTGPAGSDGSYTSVGDGLTEVTASQIAVDLAATPGLEFSGGQLQAKVDGATISRTAGGLLVPAGGIGTNELSLSTVAQAEAEAGAATTERLWTAERVKQAIEALGGGGNVELIGHTVFSGDSSVAFTGLDSHTDAAAFELDIVLHPSADNNYLELEVGTGATPTWQTANYYWVNNGERNDVAAEMDFRGVNTSELRIGEAASTNKLGTDTGENIRVRILYINPLAASSNLHHMFFWNGAGLGSDAYNLWPFWGGGRWANATAVTGLRLLLSAGATFTEGFASLRKYKNA